MNLNLWGGFQFCISVPLSMMGVLPTRTYSPSGDEKPISRNSPENSLTHLYANRKE